MRYKMLFVNNTMCRGRSLSFTAIACQEQTYGQVISCLQPLAWSLRSLLTQFTNIQLTYGIYRSAFQAGLFPAISKPTREPICLESILSMHSQFPHAISCQISSLKVVHYDPQSVFGLTLDAAELPSQRLKHLPWTMVKAQSRVITTYLLVILLFICDPQRGPQPILQLILQPHWVHHRHWLN